jgi:hypothetical protein
MTESELCRGSLDACIRKIRALTPSRLTLSLILIALVSSSATIATAEQPALGENDLLELLANGVYNSRIAALVREHG